MVNREEMERKNVAGGQIIPSGYKTIGEKGHKIHVPDEEKSPLIKKMFDLYASGQYSTKKLCDVMYEQGLRSRTGHKVSHARIHQLVGDPFYYGMNRWKNQITKGNHEPLISKELYQRVQDRLHSYGAPRTRKHNSLFKSVFRCIECNGTITWEIQKGHWYGHCNHYKNCSQREWVKQENIDIQIAESIVAVTMKDERVERMLFSFLFSNPKINGKNVEISYQKPFQLILDTVSEALSEKNTRKNTFEPPKEPVNKGKTPAFADAHPIWLRR